MAHLWRVQTDTRGFGAHDMSAEDEAAVIREWAPVGETKHLLNGHTVTVTAIEHSPNCAVYGACSPGYTPPAPRPPRTLESELRGMLCSVIDRAVSPRIEALIAGAIDRTEPDEEIVLRGTGRRYVHSGMHEGVSVSRIRARYTDGSERDLYLLTMVDVGEDADVNFDLYGTLEALQRANTWLREAF